MTTHLLLAVAGTTPATITEAVYALAVTQGVALDEIRVLTTRSAREFIEPKLAEALEAMGRHYKKAKFPRTIEWRVLSLSGGKKAEDIRTSAENEELFDWIAGEVRKACANESTVVHASLAGGRKTMSFALGAAMQFFGRPQDKLYHVLVDSAFEVPGFLYPHPPKAKPALITNRNGTTVDPREAKVDLAEVPFVPLSKLAGIEDLGNVTFRQLVARAKDALSQERMAVRVVIPGAGKSGKCLIQFAEEARSKALASVSYQGATTAEFVFYVWLLWRQKRGLPPAAMTSETAFQSLIDDRISMAKSLLLGKEQVKILRQVESDFNEARRKSQSGKPAEAAALTEFLQGNWYGEVKYFPSRLAKKISKAFGDDCPGRDPSKYFIRYSSGAFSLDIPADRIILPAELEKDLKP